MSNPIVDSIVSNLESGMLDAAKQAGIKSAEEIVSGAKSFLSMAIPSIERWITGTLSTPATLTPDELKVLLEDLLEDALVHGLTLLEKTEIKIDEADNMLLSLVTGVVASAVGKAITL